MTGWSDASRVLFSGIVGYVDGFSVDDNITDAADIAMAKVGGPKLGWNAHTVTDGADSAKKQLSFQVQLVGVTCNGEVDVPTS